MKPTCYRYTNAALLFHCMMTFISNSAVHILFQDWSVEVKPNMTNIIW